MLLDACSREWMVQNSCFFAVSVPLANNATAAKLYAFLDLTNE